MIECYKNLYFPHTLYLLVRLLQYAETVKVNADRKAFSHFLLSFEGQLLGPEFALTQLCLLSQANCLLNQ